jgi:hypothetical protein
LFLPFNPIFLADQYRPKHSNYMRTKYWPAQ